MGSAGGSHGQKDRMPHPRRRELAVGKTISIRIELNEIVEVWRGGDWQCLIPSESLEIIRKRDACIRSFPVYCHNSTHYIDLESMTRTDKGTGRTRAIRFTHLEAVQDSRLWDFDRCKESFAQLATSSVDSEPVLTEDDLLCRWPGAVVDGDLLAATVHKATCLEWISSF